MGTAAAAGVIAVRANGGAIDEVRGTDPGPPEREEATLALLFRLTGTAWGGDCVKAAEIPDLPADEEASRRGPDRDGDGVNSLIRETETSLGDTWATWGHDGAYLARKLLMDPELGLRLTLP